MWPSSRLECVTLKPPARGHLPHRRPSQRLYDQCSVSVNPRLWPLDLTYSLTVTGAAVVRRGGGRRHALVHGLVVGLAAAGERGEQREGYDQDAAAQDQQSVVAVAHSCGAADEVQCDSL